MRSIRWRRVLLVLAGLAWLVAIIWFIIYPGFEPLSAFVVGLMSLIGSIALPEPGSATPESDEDVENPGFTIVSSRAGWGSGGIEFTGEEFVLGDELVLSLWARICVHNSGSPSSVGLSVASIGPDSLSSCLIDATSVEEIETKIRHRKMPRDIAVDLGNPFIAEAGDKNIEVEADMMFSVPELEQVYGALASFKEMILVFEARLEGTGKRLLLEPLSLDLSLVHRRIEEEVVRKIPKYQIESSRPFGTQQLVQTLKRYWTGSE